MPTPPLPLLHQLLSALRIPVLPPSLSATPPSLLLIILEAILGARLPLPHPIRLCQTRQDELAVTKCILGVLADDILGMDLSIIDPARVVKGKEQEMAVIVMALVVVAKRKGIHISFPTAETDEEEDDAEEAQITGQINWLRGVDDDLSSDLPPPITPDVSYCPGPPSSPIPRETPSTDVFGARQPFFTRWKSSSDIQDHYDDCSLDTRPVTNLAASPDPQSSPIYNLTASSNGFDPYVTPLHCVEREERQVLANSKRRSPAQMHSHPSLDSATSNKTVLQLMLEEFGLDLVS
ncbi:hypothetical protein IAR55_005905 [Kwoniella newhampshirensis]|uniref:DUF5745 domain-containing protein n=1 Tax=Kwoniella newhampshirensis TaxID=1651941 RepID=A0AAW0YH42_9TREE